MKEVVFKHAHKPLLKLEWMRQTLGVTTEIPGSRFLSSENWAGLTGLPQVPPDVPLQ